MTRSLRLLPSVALLGEPGFRSARGDCWLRAARTLLPRLVRLHARRSQRRQLLMCCCSVATSTPRAGTLLQLLLCSSTAAASATQAPRKAAARPAPDALLRRPSRAASASTPATAAKANLRALVLRVKLPSTCAPLYARQPTATAQVRASPPASGGEAVRCRAPSGGICPACVAAPCCLRTGCPEGLMQCSSRLRSPGFTCHRPSAGARPARGLHLRRRSCWPAPDADVAEHPRRPQHVCWRLHRGDGLLQRDRRASGGCDDTLHPQQQHQRVRRRPADSLVVVRCAPPLGR